MTRPFYWKRRSVETILVESQRRDSGKAKFYAAHRRLDAAKQRKRLEVSQLKSPWIKAHEWLGCEVARSVWLWTQAELSRSLGRL